MTMNPWTNHQHDIGFVFNVKCGSSTMRGWGRENNFEPIPPHNPSRLIGIVREPRSRFISMVQTAMTVYARNTLEEDPGVFDRVWPNWSNILHTRRGEWYSINVHFVKQCDLFKKFPPTEFWALDELDEKLRAVILEYGFTVPMKRKVGNPYILEKIEESITPELEEIIRSLYKEDFDIYNQVKNSV